MVLKYLICFHGLCVTAADAAQAAHHDQTTITIFLLFLEHQHATVPFTSHIFVSHLHFLLLYFRTRNEGGGFWNCELPPWLQYFMLPHFQFSGVFIVVGLM